MELFRIIDGPWEKLFEGKFQEHEIEVYSNDKSVLIVLVFEKEGGKTVGSVVEIYKVFHATGELEPYIESLPRNIIFLSKHGEKGTEKFMLLGMQPAYLEWEEEAFSTEADRLLKKIETSSKILVDVAKAYDIELTELSKAPSGAKKAFFSMPLLAPILSTNYQDAQLFSEQAQQASGVSGPMFHEFIVGLTRQKEKIVEPVVLFSKTLVSGGTKNDRLLACQLLSEGFLLAGVPVIIFDFEGVFFGLNQPTDNIEELKRYSAELEPMGFPARSFSPVTDLKIDLNFIEPFGFAEAMGFGQSPAVEIIASLLMEEKISSLKDAIQKVKLVSAEKFNEFEINRAARILLLLEKNYSGLFDGKNNVQEIAARKIRALGSASVIQTGALDERAKMVFFHNIVSSVIDFFKNNKMEGKSNAVIVVPEAKGILNEKISPAVVKDIKSLLSQFSRYGVGFILSGETEQDFSAEITAISEAGISVIRENDCAVSLKGRKSYRVMLRPTFSSNSFSKQKEKAVAGK